MKDNRPKRYREEENKKPILNHDGRKIRGYAIISKGDNLEIINDNVYRVPSQSGNGTYIVAINHEKFACECPDFQTRQIYCKHIYAIMFWRETKRKIEKRETVDVTMPEEKRLCVYCKSESMVKFGRIEGTDKQRYQCRACKKTFVADHDFRKFKGDSKVIVTVIDLYFKGISLRKIQDHVKQFYGIKITHITVYYWIKRFTKLMDGYVSTFKPEVSGSWSTDEQMLKLKKEDKLVYCWNIIDRETRFLIANNITDQRSLSEARQVFAKSKTVTDRKPFLITTDGLQSYKKAIRKEYGFWKRPKTKHIHNVGITKNPNNNRVERFHNTFRERDKVIRGFQNNQTAQEWATAFRLYYNFIRPHTGLNGLTPSEMAGIKLGLKGNKWEELLRMSLKKKSSTEV